MHMSVCLLVSVGSGARSLLLGFPHRRPLDLPFAGSASYAVSARLVSMKQCKKLWSWGVQTPNAFYYFWRHTLAATDLSTPKNRAHSDDCKLQLSSQASVCCHSSVGQNQSIGGTQLDAVAVAFGAEGACV